MAETVKIDWPMLIMDIKALIELIDWQKYDGMYCVPKNGLIIGGILNGLRTGKDKVLKLDLDAVTERTLILDDLIDSGTTRAQFPNNNFAVLYKKPHSPRNRLICVREIDGWIQMPFEADNDIEVSILRLLQYLGEDVNREGLKDTPKRVIKMFLEATEGYAKKPEEIFKSKFKCDNDQMVVVKGIDFFSLCEHHLIVFTGQVHIAYIPNGEVLGLSKFARLVDIFARRLQIQERMTQEIAYNINKNLNPLGVMVVVDAKHFCMCMRGVKKINATTVTSSLCGTFLQDHKPKTEALKLMGY